MYIGAGIGWAGAAMASPLFSKCNIQSNVRVGNGRHRLAS